MAHIMKTHCLRHFHFQWFPVDWIVKCVSAELCSGTLGWKGRRRKYFSRSEWWRSTTHHLPSHKQGRSSCLPEHATGVIGSKRWICSYDAATSWRFVISSPRTRSCRGGSCSFQYPTSITDIKWILSGWNPFQSFAGSDGGDASPRGWSLRYLRLSILILYVDLHFKACWFS